MEKKLEITCSPGTFNHESYRQSLVSQAMGTHGRGYNGVFFTQLAPEENTPTVDEQQQIDTRDANEVEEDEMFTPIEKEKCDEKQNWLEAPTKLMLALIAELRPKVGKSAYVKTKMAMYKQISMRMAEKGYFFTVSQIENKFRGLERQYKRTVLNNRQSGRNRQTCQYMSELEEILGEKRGVNPEFILNSAYTKGRTLSAGTLEEGFDGEQSVLDNTPSCLHQPPMRKKTELTKKFDELLDEEKKFHADFFEMAKKKEEAREERFKKKNGVIGEINAA